MIRKRLHELARQRPRFGYRQMTRLLRLEGFRVSFKRVHRIWRAEGLESAAKTEEKASEGKVGQQPVPSFVLSESITFGVGTSSSIGRPAGIH